MPEHLLPVEAEISFDASIPAESFTLSEVGKRPVVAKRMGERQEIFGRRKSGEEVPAEASISRLELAQFAVQASAQVFNTLRDSSLLNFLRI